jgi:hypothetical protein
VLEGHCCVVISWWSYLEPGWTEKMINLFGALAIVTLFYSRVFTLLFLVCHYHEQNIYTYHQVLKERTTEILLFFKLGTPLCYLQYKIIKNCQQNYNACIIYCCNTKVIFRLKIVYKHIQGFYTIVLNIL